MDKCSGCHQKIKLAEKISCVNCTQKYHSACVGLPAEKFRKLTKDERSLWKCPECLILKPRGDNSNTPIRSNLIPPDEPESDGSANESEPLAESDVAVDANLLKMIKLAVRQILKEEISSLRSDFQSVKEDLTAIKISVENCQKVVNDFEIRLSSVECKIAAIEEQNSSICFEEDRLREKIQKLENDMDSQMQLALANQLEISGIVEQPNENLNHVVMVIAQKIGVEIDEKDIDWTSRAGRKQSTSTDIRFSRPVVVRFARRLMRERFLKAARVRRGLTTEDTGLPGPALKIYVNDRLTRKNRQLFRETRIYAKQVGFKYVWISNGVIYVRRREGSGAVAVKTTADLDIFKGQTAPTDSNGGE